MEKGTEKLFFQMKKYMKKEKCEKKLFKIFGHQRNANRNYIKISRDYNEIDHN